MPFILKTSNLILISDVSVKNDPKGKKKTHILHKHCFQEKERKKNELLG